MNCWIARNKEPVGIGCEAGQDGMFIFEKAKIIGEPIDRVEKSVNAFLGIEQIDYQVNW